MRLSIVIFDGVTSLDFIGGYETLSRIPGMETEFVSAKKGIVATDTRALGVLAWRTFDEVKSTDIIYVPGGPGAFALEEDAAFLSWLRAMDAASTWTVGVCNGVSVLGAAGLLKGREVTTNWFHRERMGQWGATFLPKRFHRDGKVVTGAGVSASIDAGLFLTGLIMGDAFAKTLQLGIEYYPAPPYPEATPAEAPADAHALIGALEASHGAGDLLKRPAFAGGYSVVEPAREPA